MNVAWEEEVPLNTGETMWIRRVDMYKRTIAYANPLKMVWGIDGRTYAFEWQGQSYSYAARPNSLGPIMFHVYPGAHGFTIVDSAWPTRAGFGEYQRVNGRWTLQRVASAALIGRPINIMRFYSGDEGEIPKRVTQEWIKKQPFDLPQNGRSDTHLLASKVSPGCAVGK